MRDSGVSLWLQFEQVVNEILRKQCDVLVALLWVWVWVLKLSCSNVSDRLCVIVAKEGRHTCQPEERYVYLLLMRTAAFLTH